MGGQNGYPPLLVGGSPTLAVWGRVSSHGAQSPWRKPWNPEPELPLFRIPQAARLGV